MMALEDIHLSCGLARPIARSPTLAWDSQITIRCTIVIAISMTILAPGLSEHIRTLFSLLVGYPHINPSL